MLWPSSPNAFGMIACACTSMVFTRLPLITVCLRWPPARGAADTSLVALQPWNTMEFPLLPVFLVLIYVLLGVKHSSRSVDDAHAVDRMACAQGNGIAACSQH